MRLGKSTLLLSIICVLLLMACSGRHRAADEGKPVITVSIPAQQWLLQQIAGDRMEVQSLLGPASNPETFEPDMRQLMNLEHSRAFFRTGMAGFEESMLEKIAENFPSLRICNSAGGIIPLKHTHEGGVVHEEYDPHIWTSLKNARIMAAEMLREIIAIDPEGKSVYTDNFKRLDSRLAQLDDSIARALEPSRGAAFLVWHPSLSYFARDYGLRQLAMEPEGKEASPAALRERIDLVSGKNPRVFFIQKEYDSRQAEALARELGVRTESIAVMQPDIMEQARIITRAITLSKQK